MKEMLPTLEGPVMNGHFDDFTERLTEKGFCGLSFEEHRYFGARPCSGGRLAAT